MEITNENPVRVMYSYWGRRGAVSRLILEAGRAAAALDGVSATISVSRQNRNFSEFSIFGDDLFAIDTFDHAYSAPFASWRIFDVRKKLYERIKRDNIQVLVELMPHVWSPFVMPVVRQTGCKYCTVMHDPKAHSGDRTGWANAIIDKAVDKADIVFTLTDAVNDQIGSTGRVPESKLSRLFLPDLSYGDPANHKNRPSDGRLRLLFFGRIMQYKGFPLFLDTIELLQKEGLNIAVGVFGEGPLGPYEERLQAMNAEVVNRWLEDSEVTDIFNRFDAVILSHSQASQSGVAAAALGAGLPVVATPVGGLGEQVADGKTGIIAKRADAAALAEAIKALFQVPDLYEEICENIAQSHQARSMGRFVEASITSALAVDT